MIGQDEEEEFHVLLGGRHHEWREWRELMLCGGSCVFKRPLSEVQ